MTHLKRPWCWERLNMGGEGHDRGWDGWMASPTRWTWVCASSRSWWWTGRPGVMQSMRSQRVGHDWVAELNWTDGVRVCGLDIFNGQHNSRLFSRLSRMSVSSPQDKESIIDTQKKKEGKKKQAPGSASFVVAGGSFSVQTSTQIFPELQGLGLPSEFKE